MQVVAEGFGGLRRGDVFVVVVIVLQAGDKRLVRQHETDRERKRLSCLAGALGDAEAVEVVNGRGGDVFVVDLVGALAVARQAQADAARPGRTRELAVIDALAPGLIGPVVADEPLRVPVQLVRPNRVHAANENRAIAARAHGVGEGGDAGVEDVGVGPDLVVAGVAAREHGHPRGHANRRGAIGVVERYAARGKGIEVRGLD